MTPPARYNWQPVETAAHCKPTLAHPTTGNACTDLKHVEAAHAGARQQLHLRLGRALDLVQGLAHLRGGCRNSEARGVQAWGWVSGFGCLHPWRSGPAAPTAANLPTPTNRRLATHPPRPHKLTGAGLVGAGGEHVVEVLPQLVLSEAVQVEGGRGAGAPAPALQGEGEKDAGAGERPGRSSSRSKGAEEMLARLRRPCSRHKVCGERK